MSSIHKQSMNISVGVVHTFSHTASGSKGQHFFAIIILYWITRRAFHAHSVAGKLMKLASLYCTR